MAFAAFLTALLAGMGVGSGGLFVVFLTVFLDYPQLAAQGLNLYFFILPRRRRSFCMCVRSGCISRGSRWYAAWVRLGAWAARCLRRRLKPVSCAAFLRWF